LIEKNRPKGWVGKPHIELEIQQKLERSEVLRTIVDNLHAKAKALEEREEEEEPSTF
jgi:hypothetical protein